MEIKTHTEIQLGVLHWWWKSGSVNGCLLKILRTVFAFGFLTIFGDLARQYLEFWPTDWGSFCRSIEGRM
jgi:hypothetical protein